MTDRTSENYRSVTFLIGLAVILLLPITTLFAQTTETYYASTTWTAPPGVSLVTVECWGAGGAGGGNSTNSDGSGGGGGGAYSRTVDIPITPGNTYTIIVGVGGIGVSGGIGGDGGDSWFLSSGTILALGGAGGNPPVGGAGGIGGTGGVAGLGIGTIKFSGGNGGTGRNSNAGNGGPGGSSAGIGAAGWSGPLIWSTLSASAGPSGSGIGGDGSGPNQSGNPGSIPGGAGGGSGDYVNGSSKIGGNGANGQVSLTYTAATDNCPESSSITPTGIQTVCQGDLSSQLTASVTTSGGSGTPLLLYQWYYNTTNSNTVSGATSIGGATSSTYTPLTTASEVGDRWYFCVAYATDNGCGQTDSDQTLASNAVQVSVSGTPTIASAGSPQTICDGDGAILGANTPTVGTGAWSVVSGPSTNSAQFLSLSDPGTTFTPDAGAGSYVLRWTISNASCTPSTSDVTITVNEQPTTSNAGGPQTICDGAGATLGANSPLVGTGAWSIVSGPSSNLGQFSSTASNTATFTPDGGIGDYVLRWTIANDPCTPSTSDVTITVKDIPALAVISGTATVTNGNDYVYSIPTVADATNYTWTWPVSWSIVSGQGTESITVTAGAAGGDITVYVTNSCGDGPTATFAVSVGVTTDCPVSTLLAPAGTQTLCQDDPASQLTASITSSGGSGSAILLYQWYYNTTNSNTVSGATMIVGATNSTYTPLSTASEVGDRWYFCVGYATNNGCLQTNADQALASNAVQVTVNGTPTTASAGGTQTICDGAGITLGANSPLVGTGAWSIVSGPSSNLGQFSSTTSNTATFTPDGGIGDYVLRWTISNDPCTPSTSDVTISVNDIPALPLISGTATVNTGIDYFYSIPTVSDATNYTWTWPASWSIVSGQGTESITVTAGTSGGDIAVYVSNSCGDGPTATFSVSIVGGSDCPESTLISPASTQIHCQDDPAGQLTAGVSTSGGSGTPTFLYQWYYNNTSSNTISGATSIGGATNSTYTPLTTASEAGDRWYFCVGYATDNSCGQTDTDQSLASNAVQVTISTTPAIPGTILGNPAVNEGTTGLMYGILAVTGATTYTWTVPSGWTITSGQGSTGIIVSAGAAEQNGDITVTAGNSCGTSAAQSLAVVSQTAADHSLYGCNACHISHDSPGGSLTSILGNANLCLSCHVSGGSASGKPFANADKAIPGTSGNSHAWDVASVNSTYETVLTSDPEMVLRVYDGNIVCSTCHDQHNSNTNPSYTRISNAGDAMCKDCHSPRNVGRYADNTANKGSHPVGLAYSETGDFESTPTGSVLLPGGNIECSSCHQTHYAPTNDGTLLRQTNNDALCASCHTLGTHNGMSCNDCHQTHNTNKANIYMIKNTIATPNSGNKTVNFTALTGANSFADGDATYDGICEVCHTSTAHYMNDGSATDQDHSSVGGADGVNCVGCHPHNTDFSPSTGGCTDCHITNFPGWGTTDGHLAHTSKYSYSCSTCHYQYGLGGSLELSHPSGGAANIAFDPDGMARRNGQDTNTPVLNGDKSCDNIYCHSDGRSAYRGQEENYASDPYDSDTNPTGLTKWSTTIGPQTAVYATTPAWGAGTITTCFPCHPGIGNMSPDYTINEPGPITSNTEFPATGSHAPMRNAHYTNSQNLASPATAWTRVQCFWCHETDDDLATGPKKQGTYGTSLHVDGQTHFNPRWYSNGGTVVNTMTYSLEGSAAHCGDGKACW